MSESYQHYRPIMRWKAGELNALRHLSTDVRRRITPILELCPGDFLPKRGKNHEQPTVRPSAEIIAEKFKSLNSCWGQEPVIVDLWLIKDEFIASNGEPPLSLIMRLALDSHIDIIPAVHLFPQDSSTGDHLSDAVYRELVKQSTAMKHGEVCLRVFAKDLSTPNLHNRVDDLLSDLRCGPSDTHLVVDYRLLADGAPPLSDMPNLLPHLQDWKSYSVVAGVFPKDLCEIDKNSTRLLPRVDWKWWMGNIVSDNCTIRRPAFGDYTIQHPIYSEPPEYSAPSASIRYAHHEYWVIIRGESLSNPKGSGWHQWPAEAALLVDRKEFQGGQFSFGDRYILKMSRQTKTTGTVQTWLTAGINHHLTLTSRQISSLALD